MLREKFLKVTGAVITDYKGMTVSEISGLRRMLKSSGMEYRVVKNTLARIAVQDTPLAVAQDIFNGPMGLALGYDDPTKVAKDILAFAGKNPKLKVTGGVVDGTFCAAGELKSIAELPPREVLLAVLAGTLQAPSRKLAGLLSATLSRFAYALNALRDKKAG